MARRRVNLPLPVPGLRGLVYSLGAERTHDAGQSHSLDSGEQHLMAYDPSSDASCQAWWRCEDGALGTDSSGKGNTLTETDVASSAACQEGSASCDFSGTNDEMSRADADLTANFPFKNGTTNKTVTVCFWFIADALPGSGSYRGLWGKYITTTGKRSINIGIKGKSSTQVIVFTLAPDPAVAGTEKEHGSDLATGTWYHVGVTYDNSGRSYRIRIWDDTAGAILGSDATGTFAADPAVTDAQLEIANYNGGGLGLDGRMDDIVVFNRALGTNEIDEIRSQTYFVGYAGRGIGRALGRGIMR
jgi:hypothetical protein